MLELIFWGVVIVVCLVLIYRSGKQENGFVRYFSRGAYMRELNKKMEKELDETTR